MPKKSSKYDSFFSIFRHNKNAIYFLGIVLLIFIITLILQPILLKLIESNPDLLATYNFVRQQLDKNSMLWLFIIAFLGSLFFITVPTDIIFTVYIVNGANPILTIITTFLAAMAGRSADYWIGYAFGGIVNKKVMKSKGFDFSKRKVGRKFLFFMNFIPFLPLEFIITFIGTLRYPFWKFLLYNSAGKIVKLIILATFIRYILMYNLEFINFHFFDLVRSLVDMLI